MWHGLTIGTLLLDYLQCLRSQLHIVTSWAWSSCLNSDGMVSRWIFKSMPHQWFLLATCTDFQHLWPCWQFSPSNSTGHVLHSTCSNGACLSHVQDNIYRRQAGVWHVQGFRGTLFIIFRQASHIELMTIHWSALMSIYERSCMTTNHSALQ